MTAPYAGNANITDTTFEEMAEAAASGEPAAPVASDEYPDHLVLTEVQEQELKRFLDDNLLDLQNMQASKQIEWAALEDTYRAMPGAKTSEPFVGCNRDTIPVMAMAVEPVHARLETGVFKQDPPFRVKPVKKKMDRYKVALEKWINFYMKSVIDFQRTASPRLLECAKLGTQVFKVPFVLEKCRYKMYDEKNKVKDYEAVKFRGPKPTGIELGDFLFHPLYQHLQDCPIVFERQRTTKQELKKAQYHKYLKDVEKVFGHAGTPRTDVEDAREAASNHQTLNTTQDEIVIYEAWFKYDLDGDGYPEQLVCTYHQQTRTILQLRYNPYFHQCFPYVLGPYSIANQSLYGVGIGEMTKTFQDAITYSHRNAMDNAYVANAAMFAYKRGAPGLENNFRVFAGKSFALDDPSKDLVRIPMGTNYPSTIPERQDLFGMVEKRTGVSDYMTGRESPALGSRATATSTLALIQEGTRRVEQVMENIRACYSEIIWMCMMIWTQYGLGEIDDFVFGDEETGQLLDEFFKNVVKPENMDSLLLIDVGVTDATTNRQVQQQMQLSLIQMMTQYFQQLIQAAQLAIQAQGQTPALTEIVQTVMQSAHDMYKDLLAKYDIPNADKYLPDVLSILQSPTGLGGGAPAGPGAVPQQPTVQGAQGLMALLGGGGGSPPQGPPNGSPAPQGGAGLA